MPLEINPHVRTLESGSSNCEATLPAIQAFLRVSLQLALHPISSRGNLPTPQRNTPQAKANENGWLCKEI